MVIVQLINEKESFDSSTKKFQKIDLKTFHKKRIWVNFANFSILFSSRLCKFALTIFICLTVYINVLVQSYKSVCFVLI